MKQKISILHVADISDKKSQGVSEVVPQYLKYQSKYANVALFNLSRIEREIDEKVTILNPKGSLKFDLESFPFPFNSPDIVIIQDPFNSLEFEKIVRQLIKCNLKFIVVPHCCYTKNAINRGIIKSLKKKIAMRTVLKNVTYKADAIQYLTQGEKECSYVKGNSIIIPNGVDTKSIEAKDYNNKMPRTILFLGRKNVYHKGIDLLFKACKLIRFQLESNNIKLRLVGTENKLRPSIEKLIVKYGLLSIVENLPPKYGLEKFEEMRNADLFVLTSRLEGMPLSILEAWSCGLPTLVTYETNMAEYVKQANCGWVANLNPEDIASKLLEAIECQEIPQLGYNARNFVCNNFDWDIVTKTTIDQYSEIIQQRRG